MQLYLRVIPTHYLRKVVYDKRITQTQDHLALILSWCSQGTLMRQYQIIILTSAFSISMVAEAGSRDYSVTAQTPAIKFQISKRDDTSPQPVYDIFPLSADLYRTDKEKHQSLNYYDALFYYPVHQRTGMNIDVGVNLRFQHQNTNPYQALDSDQQWLHDQNSQNIEYSSATLPLPNKTMMHANALFDLPFAGLSAGVSGSHDGRLDNAEFNYSARLNYQWKNGLGLQGGWQHQQYPLDQFNLRETVEDQRLFLDLKYKF